MDDVYLDKMIDGFINQMESGVKRMEAKKEIITKLEDVISKEMSAVVDNKDTSAQDKLEKASVLFNIHKILQNYDELQPTLIKYFSEKENKLGER